jgi:tetratricopeptide (TPR) repeat protein
VTDGLSYGFREAAALLDIEESRLRYWAQTGLVTPSGARGARRFYAFGDLIAARTIHELLRRSVPIAEVRKLMQDLRDALPTDRERLYRVSVTFDGERLEIAEGATAGDAPAAIVLAADIRARIDQASAQAGTAPSAYQHFVRGCRLEEQEERLAEAEEAYRLAVAADPALGSAWTNLGNLLHRRGDSDGARLCYERAIEVEPDQPEGRFNLANLLDEAGESEMAIAEYGRVLRAAPDFADAHYNLAMTLERIGAGQQASVHMARWRELTAGGDLAG